MLVGDYLRRGVAEFVGTFALIFVGGGAALAAFLLKWVLRAKPNLHLGAPGLGASVSAGQGVAIEAILTFFLVWVVFATAVDPRGTFKQIAGLAIGLTIVLDVLMGGNLTGGAINPARAFGPQLAANAWSNGWVWYIGPFAGGAIAAIVYNWLYLRLETEPPLEYVDPVDA